MHVSLMAHVPYYSVVRGIINVVQGDSQFDYAQRRTQVTGIDTQLFYDVFPQFFTKLRQLIRLQSPQIRWIVHLVQYNKFTFVSHSSLNEKSVQS